MAKGRHWYQRNGGDFIVGTMHMDLETRGAYSLLIDFLNDRDRPIPDEPRFIAGLLNISVRRWNQIREKLLADPSKIYLDENGCLTNQRFEYERAKRDGDYERSVENGRRGGQISAAKRQGQLELSPDYLPRESKIIPAKVEHKSEIKNSESQKTAKPNQPPPQDSRARENLEPESIQTNDQDSKLVGDAKIADDRPTDFMVDFQAVCDAAGYCPTNTTAITKAMDQVKAWRELGADFANLVLPTIRSVIADTSDPTSSLARFDKKIRHEHARQTGRPLNAGPPPKAPEPILHREGEPDEAKALRADLLKHLGPSIYARYANRVTFTVAATANGSRPLRITRDPGNPFDLYDGDRHNLINHLATKHGFTGVWST